MIEIGKSYLFMTVTHYWSGRVTAVSPTHAMLEHCAWIPQTGRLADAMKSGSFEEVEPVPDGLIIPLQGAAFLPWTHALPRKQKP